MASSAIPQETLAGHGEVLASEEHWLQAILARDVKAAGDILHPDYRLIIGIEGERLLRVMARQQWLDLLPDYRITEHALTDRRVSLYGDVAVVVMLWSQTATAPGDRDISGHFLLTDIWHNSPDGWRVIERHSSRQEKAA
jgi:ketosteroid isomerase-like protein